MNSAPPPSSFDGNTEFYEESRWQKLRRRLVEEPLIPLGCALTCWALYEATKSMRVGDKHKTNRMFRRRIYAQGFTILAMIGGQAYWASDRAKRNEYEGLLDEKKRKEKHESWIKELEARDQEEQEMKDMRRRLKQARGEALTEKQAQALESTIKSDGTGVAKAVESKIAKVGDDVQQSVLEEGEKKSEGSIMKAVRSLWGGSS